MANPKRRHSVSRKGMRRAHDFLTNPHLAVCGKCGQQVQSHEICGYCGHYRGVEIVKMEAAAAPEAGAGNA